MLRKCDENSPGLLQYRVRLLSMDLVALSTIIKESTRRIKI